jgi:hypothetical protein
MVIGANLADYYYQQVLKEEEKMICEIMEKKEVEVKEVEVKEVEVKEVEEKRSNYSFEFMPIETYNMMDTYALSLPYEEKKDYNFMEDVRFWLISFFIFSSLSLSLFVYLE